MFEYLANVNWWMVAAIFLAAFLALAITWIVVINSVLSGFVQGFTRSWR